MTRLRDWYGGAGGAGGEFEDFEAPVLRPAREPAEEKRHIALQPRQVLVLGVVIFGDGAVAFHVIRAIRAMSPSGAVRCHSTANPAAASSRTSASAVTCRRHGRSPSRT